MDVNITGNPGTGNKYNDTHIETVGCYNPNADKVYNYEAPAPETRLSCLFRKLKDEYANNIQLQKKLDDIKRYHTKLRHTVGLKQKLTDGHFSASDIEKAERSKMHYAKKATRFQYYESAQRIDAYLFAKVACRFDTYVMPLIRNVRPLDDIKTAVYEQVVSPIMQEIEANGANDTCLCYTEDNIFGILYYLTGNCHINWKDYDNDVHPGI